MRTSFFRATTTRIELITYDYSLRNSVHQSGSQLPSGGSLPSHIQKTCFEPEYEGLIARFVDFISL